MPAAYLDLVTALRQGFPQPVSDRVHDAYFVFSFLRALDQLDGMKSVSPLLGKSVELDYDAARRSRVDDDPVTLEHVTQTLVEHLSGMFIWGHPRAQINVIPPPTIASIIGGLLPSIYNPNLVSEESSRQVAVAEVEVSSMTADLIGYDPTRSAGLFTFGGTGAPVVWGQVGTGKSLPRYGATWDSRTSGYFLFRASPLCLPERRQLAGNWAGKCDPNSLFAGQRDAHLPTRNDGT